MGGVQGGWVGGPPPLKEISAPPPHVRTALTDPAAATAPLFPPFFCQKLGLARTQSFSEMCVCVCAGLLSGRAAPIWTPFTHFRRNCRS